MENSTVKIVPSELKRLVEEGKKLDWLAEYYSLPKSQMKKALQQLGLQIRKFHKPRFEFVEEPLTDEDLQVDEELLVEKNTTVSTEW